MRRFSILVSYDGTAYHGWQIQPNLPTIQGAIQAVLGQIEGKPVHVEGSGRTDAGVHALAVCAAFDLENPIPTDNLRKAMNRLLPFDIRITRVNECQEGFHPRFQAVAKTYEYRIWREEVCPPFLRSYVHHHPYPLDEAAMTEAASRLIGEHDFTAFCSTDESDILGKSKVRTIFESRLWRERETLCFRVRGSGFLKHMVRHLTGFLLEVGKGNNRHQDLEEILKGPPAKVVHSAPAKGLHQISVEYPLP